MFLPSALGRGVVALLPFLLAAAAAGEFQLSDPGSPIYYTLVAAAGQEIKVDKSVQVTGDLHSNNKVTLEEQSQIDGSVSAVAEVANKGTVTGSVTPGAPSRALPSLLSEAQARALADRVFEGEKVFADETVDDIVFVDGKARLRGAIHGTGTIIASNDIEVEKVDAGAGPGLLGASARLSLIAFQHVKVLENRSFRGALYAGSDVVLEKNVSFEGVLVARSKVDIKEAARVTFLNFDEVPPSLAVVAPGPVVTEDPTPSVSLAYSDGGSGVDLATLQVFVGEVEITSGCSLGPATASCDAPTLAAGDHAVLAHVRDRAGNLATATLIFELVLDSRAPDLLITAPAAVVLGDPTPTISSEYTDDLAGVDPASFRLFVDGADQTAGCTVAAAAALCEPPSLARGPHSIRIEIADLRGHVATAERSFTLAFPLEIAFTSPAPDSVLPVPVAAVAGTVSADAVAVEVNGVAATLAGGSFTVASLGLHDGVNNVVAVARDAAGNLGMASLRLFADTTPPRISITSPEGGAEVATPTVTVSGLVNDLTIGTVSETEIAVTVNGVPAEVNHRSFLARDVPLAPGANTVTAVAEDRAGHRAMAEVEVFFEQRAGVPSLRAVSGDGQAAAVSTELPQPLVVEVRDGAGQPQPGVAVLFRVVQGDGGFAGERLAQATTDALGRASILWTLGRRAGQGVDRVQATAVGVVGQVMFTATATAGAPAAIHVAAGDNQRGLVGAALAQPLIAVVFDDGDNPLPGVPVTFQVVTGGGSFDGAESVVVETDPSGLAVARLTLGLAPGIDDHLVEASVPGVADAVTFKSSAFVPGEAAATELVGVVLDNQGAPVPEATLRLRDETLTGTTDGQGQFRLTGVPVGRAFLIVDPSTTSRPGEWAALEFELFTLPGVVNTLERPIYILPLDVAGGIFVDETRGGTLTLPEVPGFALEVAPGSVTFPGGGRSGVVSVTAVHADRIPMAPGAGMQPRLIVTIQPLGALFDPPAALTLPNVDGLAPGAVTELFSFDHDLGAFVAVGTGTVSEDALVVRSDPGFGVLEAGWHCGSPPSGSGSGGGLSVTLSPRPIKIQYGSTTSVTAAGRPPRDGVYETWRVLSSNVANGLEFTGQPSCPGATSCANTLRSQEFGLSGTDPAIQVCGTATAEVTFRCTTNGRTTRGTATIEQGCCGKGATECRNLCSSPQTQGMCGSPCDLCGVTPPRFNPTVHSCWRIRVGSTWFCYWDLATPTGAGFVNLCCPNRCQGLSFRQWIGSQPGNFECTVAQRCDDPAFGGNDSDGDPGVSCVK